MKHSFNCKLMLFFDMVDNSKEDFILRIYADFFVIVFFDMLLVFYFAFKSFFFNHFSI